ncbi:hypothetical protein ACFO0O_17980, partial [Cobetia amphilecti]
VDSAPGARTQRPATSSRLIRALVNKAGLRAVDKGSSRYRPYTILCIFESTLPYLDASIDDVLSCLVYLRQQANEGKLIDNSCGAFEHFCRAGIHRSKDSISFILSQDNIVEYAPFLSSSILAYGLDSVGEAIKSAEGLIHHDDFNVRNQAYSVLAKLEIDGPQVDLIWQILRRSITSEEKDSCCASLLEEILNFGSKYPSYWPQIEDLLSAFSKSHVPQVVYAISKILAFQKIDFPERILHYLIMQLTNVNPEHRNTLNNIDHLLVGLVDRGNSKFTVELLESILNLGVGINSLRHFASVLLGKKPELLSYIVTRWFLDGEPKLCQSAFELLDDTDYRNISLKSDLSLLDNNSKKIFVSHKAVGWLFMRPTIAASFIFSIYGSASKDVREELEKILYDPLLLSYPGALKDYMESCIDSDFQKQLCECLLEKLQEYHSDIDQVIGLNELAVSNKNVDLYRKESNKKIQEAYEKASKGSFVDLFATKKQLLYGNSSIFYVHQENGEQVRHESQMQSFSHSTEIPRLYILDPVSLDYVLRIYRYEGMNNEADS